jgi:DNA-binding transcriptional MocR family regulator
MARYLRVVDDFASQVESGALAPGDQLPSVREAAGQYKTTASTVGRAYRHLAEAGSHLEVALAIASGQADAGLGIRAAATALDLDFVPVTREDFDIVLSADAVAAAEPTHQRTTRERRPVLARQSRRLRPVENRIR